MTQQTEDQDAPRRRSPAEVRLLIYRLSLDWIALRSTLPVPAGDTSRRSNVREYGHPAEWASDTCDEIANQFFWWHHDLAQRRGETRPVGLHQHTPNTTARTEQQVIVAAWRYLEPRIDDLIAMFDPATESIELGFQLHARIRARLGLSRGQYTLPVPCPVDECGMLTLQRIAGMERDFVVCGSCGYTIDAKHYPLLVRMAVDAWSDTPGAAR